MNTPVETGAFQAADSLFLRLKKTARNGEPPGSIRLFESRKRRPARSSRHRTPFLTDVIKNAVHYLATTRRAGFAAQIPGRFTFSKGKTRSGTALSGPK